LFTALRLDCGTTIGQRLCILRGGGEVTAARKDSPSRLCLLVALAHRCRVARRHLLEQRPRLRFVARVEQQKAEVVFVRQRLRVAGAERRGVALDYLP